MTNKIYVEVIERWLDSKDLSFTKKTKAEITEAWLKGYRGIMNSATYSRINKKLVPEKPKGVEPLNYILYFQNLKKCGKCTDIKSIEDFPTHNSMWSGKNGYCKVCQTAAEKPSSVYRAAKYRAAKIERTPNWVNIAELRKAYTECPDNMQVDHIVPLQGVRVSGLHVPWNLQYLSREDNAMKSNKFQSPGSLVG